MKNYRESTENMTGTLTNQFSKLVKDHVERNMVVLHETDLRIGPTTPKGYCYAVLSLLIL